MRCFAITTTGPHRKPKALPTARAGHEPRTKQAEAEESRSKGRRLLPSRRSSPKATSNASSSRGGERGDGPPGSPTTARDTCGDGADFGAPGLLEHQGAEEGRALLLGRRAAGSAPPNPAGGVSGQPAAAAGLDVGKKVKLLLPVGGGVAGGVASASTFGKSLLSTSRPTAIWTLPKPCLIPDGPYPPPLSPLSELVPGRRVHAIGGSIGKGKAAGPCARETALAGVPKLDCPPQGKILIPTLVVADIYW